MKRTYFILVLLLLLAFPITSLMAGTINGKVFDASNQDPLVGANVLLEGTSMGAATDMEGYFRIVNVPEGRYTIVVTYIGYQTKRLTNLEVGADERVNLTIEMLSAAVAGETIVVEEEAAQSTSSGLLLEQRNATSLQDGISAAQISEAGDSDAADAIMRVTGVSVLNGSDVYVRGLGDRYTQTQMNGVPVPSPNPEKKTVPLNLFSSSLIESITAAKTFTPDLPGVFAGGSVNIRTKAYPDNRVLNASIGTDYKTYGVSDITYLTSDQGSYDFWGFDDGTRAMPSSIPEDKRLDRYSNALARDFQERLSLLGRIGRDFDTDFQVRRSAPRPPVSLGVNYGDKFNPSPNLEYGFFSNLKFSNDYGYVERLDREHSIAAQDTLYAKKDMTSRESSYDTNLGVTFSAGLTLYNTHQLKFHNVYTHGSENAVTLTEGYADNIDQGLFLKQFYVEKSLNSATFRGIHDFNLLWDQHLEWSLTSGYSRLSEPDVNRLNYRLRPERDETVYQMDTYSWSAGTREFTWGFDRNQNFDLNHESAFYDKNNAEYKVKIGLRVQENSRQFEKRSFYHEYSGGGFPAEISEITDKYNVGSGLVNRNYYSYENGQAEPGLFIAENTKGSDAYEAGENLDAEYFMVNVPLGLTIAPALNRIRFIGGLRREAYTLDLFPFDPVTEDPYTSSVSSGDPIESTIDEMVYLPSYNFIAKLTPHINLRLAHSRTVARPEFREIAPFEFQSFYGAAVRVGFPFLKTTRVKNYDLRFEWYPSAAEMLSVSLFTKDFTNPIEISLVQTADRTYQTPQNALSATNTGIEFEIRERLDFIPTDIGYVNIHLNSTYIQSTVNTDSTVTLFNGYVTQNSATTEARPMEGQSDFLFNGSISYNNLSGFRVSLAYNTFSKRLISLGTAGLPNIYEYPFHSLNLTAGKTIGNFTVDFKIKNLLDARHRFGQMDPGLHELKLTKAYRTGRTFSMGVSYSL